MGRPSIGKRAMTTAERQRRFWARKLRCDPATLATLRKELAQAKKRIAELEKSRRST